MTALELRVTTVSRKHNLYYNQRAKVIYLLILFSHCFLLT